MRITKQDLTVLFQNLCRLMNKNIGHNKGDWALEYNSVHGWGVVEYHEHGGVSCPFGWASLKTKDMYYALYYAVETARMMKHV